MLAVALSAAPALAQGAPPERVRGTVEAFDGKTLTVKSRGGTSVVMPLATHFTVTGIQPASLTDIKPGSYIGTAAMPGADTTLKALEVLVFPPQMRGAGEGHRPWDLMPQSTMTNATVTKTVAGVQGRTVTLTYKGGEQTVTLPDGVPIVTVAPATAADLTPGAPVVVFPQVNAEGKVAAMGIIVGNHGVAPPM